MNDPSIKISLHPGWPINLGSHAVPCRATRSGRVPRLFLQRVGNSPAGNARAPPDIIIAMTGATVRGQVTLCRAGTESRITLLLLARR